MNKIPSILTKELTTKIALVYQQTTITTINHQLHCQITMLHSSFSTLYTNCKWSATTCLHRCPRHVPLSNYNRRSLQNTNKSAWTFYQKNTHSNNFNFSNRSPKPSTLCLATFTTNNSLISHMKKISSSISITTTFETMRNLSRSWLTCTLNG